MTWLTRVCVNGHALCMNSAANKTAIAKAALALAASKLSPAEQLILRRRQERKGARHG